VTNAASYATGAVSPGELVTLFGTAIGPATAAYATTDPSTGKLATTIGGVQVLFNGTARSHDLRQQHAGVGGGAV
jgi:uncharacterized protein (TIGR03437 family)